MLNIDGFLKAKKSLIKWENVRTKNYFTNFTIYSNENPSEINKGFNYLSYWNIDILCTVIRTILSEKNIELYE